MPLLDHFHAPVFPTHTPHSFLGSWACGLSAELNRTLPRRYLSEVAVRSELRVATEVAGFREVPEPDEDTEAEQPPIWAPPPAHTVPLAFPADIEARVYDLERDRRLIAAIELVSPSNKHSRQCLRGFAGKCATYLQRGVGVIIVDIVTNRGGNLHRELLELLDQRQAFGPPADAELYAVAYRPAQRGEQSQLDIWPHALAIGQPLPTLPLALRGAFFVPVDLEARYMEARQHCRLA
jgi:hypothetical protein